MKLTDLPEEILVIIIKKLDLTSVYHLYESCVHLKNIVNMYNVVKICDMKLNKMATAQTLKLKFIEVISGHFQELDVCGVFDLNKTTLLMAAKRMKCLKTLNVSYTNINLMDLIEVYKICPSIKNISCNFVYGKGFKVPQKYLTASQNLFKNFENINLVGNATNLIHTNLALWVVQEAKVNNLQFTIAENHSIVHQINDDIEDDNKIVSFKNFAVYVLNDWRMNNPSPGSLYIPKAFTKAPAKKKYEYIAIVMSNCVTYSVYASPMFETFFIEHFQIKLKCVDNINTINYVGNSVVMLWHNTETIFDKIFYADLKIKLMAFFPCYRKVDNASLDEIETSFFRVLPEKVERSNTSTYIPEFKKRRQGVSHHILNYDDALDKKKKINLTLFFPDCISCPIVLSSTSEYLRRLVYLTLNGSLRYGKEFFPVLFRCCEQLETLNIETPNSIDCTPFLARNIHLSHSLKNLRILDKRINFKLLFPCVSQCYSIENMHIVDMSQEINELGDPSLLFEKCKNLYCIFIHASMSQTSKTKNYQVFKKLKDTYYKPYLFVELTSMYSESRYKYDPYIDVFRLNPIRPYKVFFFYVISCQTSRRLT